MIWFLHEKLMFQKVSVQQYGQCEKKNALLCINTQAKSEFGTK